MAKNKKAAAKTATKPAPTVSNNPSKATSPAAKTPQVPPAEKPPVETPPADNQKPPVIDNLGVTPTPTPTEPISPAKPNESDAAAENKPSTDESLTPNDSPLATNTAESDAAAENGESSTDNQTPPVLKIEAGKTYFTKSNQFLKVLERDGDTVHYELYTLNNKKAVEGRITSSLEKLNGEILHLVDTETELPAAALNSNVVAEGGENVFVKLANNQELRAVLFPDKLVFQDGKTVENPELADLIEKQLYKIRTY